MKTTRREIEVAVATLPEDWEGDVEEALARIEAELNAAEDPEYEREVHAMLDGVWAELNGPNPPSSVPFEDLHRYVTTK